MRLIKNSFSIISFIVDDNLQLISNDLKTIVRLIIICNFIDLETTSLSTEKPQNNIITNIGW